MRRVCRLSPAADRGRWSPADVVAGIVGKSTIKRFGQKGHTAFSNVINFVANLIWAVDTGERGTIASQVVMSLAHRKRDGLESMIYKLGTSKWAAGARARARGKGGGRGSGEEDGEEVEAWGRGEVQRDARELQERDLDLRPADLWSVLHDGDRRRALVLWRADAGGGRDGGTVAAVRGGAAVHAPVRGGVRRARLTPVVSHFHF